MIVSSAETVGAFNIGFDTGNLHRPTKPNATAAPATPSVTAPSCRTADGPSANPGNGSAARGAAATSV